MSNGVTLIDDSDYLAASNHKWYCARNCQTYYVTASNLVNGKRIMLHRYLLGVTDKKVQIDHINGNGLDNRRMNLRLCSTSENHANQFHIYGKSSKFKGVHWSKQKKKWSAVVCKKIDGKKKKFYFGFHTNEIDAAFAYDAGAKQLFGVFARTNFGDVNISQRETLCSQ